ncbi:hypothetical protein cypCar_00037253 [Cyprinus carpio]|nr:hypothetical protein cypCar_00037253 [Cyprinus carpio]
MYIYFTVIGMSMKISQTYDISLTNQSSTPYNELSKRIESAINTSYSKKITGYEVGSAKVTGFRSGSVIADYTIIATSNSLDFVAANIEVSDSLSTQGLNVTKDDLILSAQKDLTTEPLYPLQKVVLNCTQTEFANGQIKWTVDDKDPALNKTRYLISPDNRTLTVINATEQDSGRYSCIIQGNVTYVQWQNIAIKKRPSINVGEKDHYIFCDGSSLQLKCSVDVGYNIEWILGEEVLMSGTDSITYNHKIKNVNCTEEIFTCRLRDLPQLQDYGYSQSRVTVKISTANALSDDVCHTQELGAGKTNDVRTGVCGNGLKGNIIYKCESRNWKSIENNCVLEVIDKLTSTVESLLVEEIPVFMANLSNATEQHNINITQSPATVQAIVDILSTIANLSKSVFINKPVMEDFLKTVDIIISDNVSNTWSILENKTSIKLLRAIEDISDRLTENGEIYKTSIQLIRATVTNSFNLTSSLPNSTTEIVIPQVPRATNITIIIFTTLDNVLPTHGSNDSRKSDVRINGDVVVVKVDNKMINNISFTFDITNQSLGNPQCVFWNFILDNWDSTGCEVKRNNIGNTTCECNHTTSFSILMSPFHIDPSHRTALAYITYIGVAISIASLIICLIIEIIVWKSMTRNDTSYMRHVSIVNIAVSLLIANICFIIGAAIAEQEQPTSVDHCSPAVFFMHFFYLALFFWMLMSALLLFYRTVMVLSQMSRAKMMAIAFIVGYGAPLLIAAITVASTAGQENYISKRDACWLNWYESKALLAFVIPALTIVAINLVVLAVVLYKILRRGVGAATQPDEKHALVVIARCVAILTPIFGLTWGFGIGTMVSQKQGIHVVFALLNSLQGFFILVFGTLLDSKNTSAGTLSTSGLPFLRRWRSLELLEFIVVIEVNASQAVVIEQIRASLASITFPLQLDNSTEVTAANITTVCQPNVTEYQCVCEDGYAWSYNNCKTYEACGDISFGSCGCINGIPSDGDMCVLESELPFTDFLFEIEVESSSISVIDEMRRYLQNITFPLQLDEVVEVLDVDITTVCNFNDSGYKCVCEDQYFWPCDKCKEYGSCDGITNNTCSCINDIPSDRQFCQTVSEITNNTACGQPPSVIPVPAEYLTEIQIDVDNPAIIDHLRNLLMFFSLPYTVSDSTNITEINITTVCSLNETQYQCKCEGLFVWPNDTCHSYEACDDITDGSCTCINALPIDGQFCQLKEEL